MDRCEKLFPRLLKVLPTFGLLGFPYWHLGSSFYAAVIYIEPNAFVPSYLSLQLSPQVIRTRFQIAIPFFFHCPPCCNLCI